MSKNSNVKIVTGSSGSIEKSSTASARKKLLRRYQLSWNPSFYSESNSKVYILGENLIFGNGGNESADDVVSTYNLQEIIDKGAYNGIVLPLNTNIALAQEYAPSIKNKVVQYETVGGNSITTFGEAIRVLGMRIRIIKLSDAWQSYYKGLEALSYLSSNQARYYGSLYLTGYDSFSDKPNSSTISYRYRVTISTLDFNFKSDSNTTVTADLKMFVNQDLSKFRRDWGNL